MKKFIFTAILALGINAFAIGDFSGHWISEGGEVVSDLGLNSKCSRIEIVIEQTDIEIVTKQYTSTCDLFGSSWGPMVQQIENGKVFEHGEEVGTVDDTTLVSVAPSETVFYLYNLQLVPAADGSMELESVYGVKNYLGTIRTMAHLKRK